MTGYLFLGIVLFALTAWYVGRREAMALAATAGSLHSRPVYHGAFVAVWVGIPALILVLFWFLFQDAVVDRLIIASLPADLTEDATPARISLLLSEIRNVAQGKIFSEPSPAIASAAERYGAWQQIARWAMVVVTACMMCLALIVARRRLAPRSAPAMRSSGC
jgi:phosphate transport system permease protein